MKLDRGHAKRVRFVRVFAVGVSLGLGSMLLGCPGTLSPDDYDKFEPVECDGDPEEVAKAIFQNSCGTGCHDAEVMQGGLDLISPGVEERLFGVNAGAFPACSDRVLAVPGDSELSYLVDKVTDSPGICGQRMPLAAMLTPAETACIEAWINGYEASSQAEGVLP